jgi:hypothetical protein
MRFQLNAIDDFSFMQLERSNYIDFRFKITDLRPTIGSDRR